MSAQPKYFGSNELRSEMVRLGAPSVPISKAVAKANMSSFPGTPGTIRTRDPLVRSQMLYPLSYGGVVNPLGNAYSTCRLADMLSLGLRPLPARL